MTRLALCVSFGLALALTSSARADVAPPVDMAGTPDLASAPKKDDGGCNMVGGAASGGAALLTMASLLFARRRRA